MPFQQIGAWHTCNFLGHATDDKLSHEAQPELVRFPVIICILQCLSVQVPILSLSLAISLPLFLSVCVCACV